MSLTDESKDDCEERCCRKGESGVELQHLEQLHDEDEDLVLGVAKKHRDRNSLKKS